MQLKGASAVALVVLMTGGCGSDKVTEVASERSPDEKAIAVYRTYSYGGALGGVGHCISIYPVADGDRDECMLLASQLGRASMSWQGNVLVVHYSAASITKFRNMTYIREVSGEVSTYEIELVRDGR